VAAGGPRLTRGRRVSLPGIHELLRPATRDEAAHDGRPASGREAHPQKITVYLSAEELLDLERARLSLRARGLSVDRGRMVREAIAALLADLDAGVESSLLARRLRGSAASPAAGQLPAGTP
jgi:hypothetical protein